MPVALVSAAHYPPIGTRGFATYSRAGRFGADAIPPPTATGSSANTLVLGMIESPAGVAAAAEIVATPGLDGIMIGPADLAAASGPADLPLPRGDRTGERGDRRRGQAPHGHRGDRTGRRAAAFDDGAQLVVYNLAYLAHGASEGTAGSARLTRTRRRGLPGGGPRLDAQAPWSAPCPHERSEGVGPLEGEQVAAVDRDDARSRQLCGDLHVELGRAERDPAAPDTRSVGTVTVSQGRAGGRSRVDCIRSCARSAAVPVASAIASVRSTRSGRSSRGGR